MFGILSLFTPSVVPPGQHDKKEFVENSFADKHFNRKKNRYILEVARAMMNEKNLSKSYWAETANTDIYLMNWCTTFGVHVVTPHEKYYARSKTYPIYGYSTLSHMCIFPVKCDRSEFGELYPRGVQML